jgi:glycosyltransferase involved in cell wall biosynthesis
MIVSVIIPALDEAGCIGELVRDTLVQPVDEVVVVDNGSGDDTAGVARRSGARVVVEERRGYGYACAAGAVAADTADILVFMDGDYSFLPAELPVLLAPLQGGQADLALGSRVLGAITRGAMPPHQRLGNWLIARLVHQFYGLALTDLGPYRAVRRDLLVALQMQEMTYGWPVEMIVKAAHRRVRITEVPVSYRPRRAGRSKVSGTIGGSVLATYRILSVTLRRAR